MFSVEIDGKEYQVVNEDDYQDNFWGHNYLVSLASTCTPMVVNADCGQSALDEFADYAQSQGWNGLFLDDSDMGDYHEDDISYVGNNGLPVFSGEIFLQEIV